MREISSREKEYKRKWTQTSVTDDATILHFHLVHIVDSQSRDHLLVIVTVVWSSDHLVVVSSSHFLEYFSHPTSTNLNRFFRNYDQCEECGLLDRASSWTHFWIQVSLDMEI